MNTPPFSSTDLNQLQRQLDSWRRRQQGRSCLPSAVWEGATHLARIHGVSHVARTLRIDFYKLQRRVEDSPVAEQSAPPAASASFIELKVDPAVPRSGPGGVVELSDGSQRRLRLKTGYDPALWMALAESFWRPRP